MRPVFVYGTLLEGLCNHHLLEGARFAGRARTEPGYELVDLGSYPGLAPGSGDVAGEVYEVDDGTLARLDELEQVPDAYQRELVLLDDGREVETYVLTERQLERPRVDGGNWRKKRTWFASRWLYLRLIGLVYLVAFLSFWVQLDGLIGSDGILPAAEHAEMLRDFTAWYEAPSLCRWFASDAFLHLFCAAGVVLALLLVFDVAPLVGGALLWALYLSLIIAGNVFYSYQWDILLLEAGFLALFIAPLRLLPRPSRDPPPPRAGMLLVRWLLFRLMFLSGAVKLLSADEPWWNLTALEYHYWTQPLPTGTSWFVHQLPAWIHSSSVVGMFVVELLVPFLVFGPRLLQRIACVAFVGVQLLIGLTGNYGFFNLLSIALCVALLDDVTLARLTPRRWRFRGPFSTRSKVPLAWPRTVHAVLALLIAAVGAMEMVERLSRGDQKGLVPGFVDPIVEWYQPVLRRTSPFRTINSYGLFANMTESRPEIVIEGTFDGRTWQAYELRWKPGRLDRRPELVQPHMPRLDWQMWFAALSPAKRSGRWFLPFVTRLLEGEPCVLDLLEENPFADEPPRYLRALLYEYRFSDPEHRAATGEWWVRELRGVYLRPVMLDAAGDLVPAH